MSGHLGAAPYTPEPAHAPRASWWRNVRRIWAASKRRRTRLDDIASPRPTVAVFHGLAAFVLLVGGHPVLAAIAIVPALMMADGPFGVLRVLWRLRAARRVMRVWAARGGATLTTFPALAAYRELARTGDVEAFAAKDLRPVTRFVRAPPEDAFEVDVESAEARRGRAG